MATIMREIQKVNENFWIFVEMDDVRPKKVEIFFRDRENNDMIPFFKDRGFEIEEYKDRGFFAETSVCLEGNETKKEIIEKVISKCQ